MDSSIKRLAVICARGNSKGVHKKNLRILAGKPLITHSILHAASSKMFNFIAISSDSSEILNVGKSSGADFSIERPAHLADDKAPKIPAIRHCTESVEKITKIMFDTIVDLDVTAPLRQVSDIHGAVHLLESSNADNVVSGMRARRSPYFNLVEEDKNGRVHLSKKPLGPIARRQDSPRCFDLNASIFCWKRESLISGQDTVIGKNTILFEMPEERSIDIDTELDFAFTEFILKYK